MTTINASANGELKRNAVGLWNIVFFVVAAASPLASMLGSVPPAFALGNGIGVPSAYVIAGLILIVFSVGYARMSRHVRSAGAFFAFVSKGLGPEFGCAAVALAMVAYHATQCALYCLFGLFVANLVNSYTGVTLAWGWYALICAIGVALCGRRHVEFSGRLLAVLMLGEVLILFALSVAILVQRPLTADSFQAFEPATAFAPGLGVALAFAMASFAGFEATTIFSEEARNPTRTIPRAAYLSIVLIALFYGYTTWSAIQGYGDGAVVQAAKDHPDTFWFVLSDHYLGPVWTSVMNILLVTSIFASILAFHNTITRYLYTLGRCKLLPGALGRVHPVYQSPHVATVVQTLLALGAMSPFILAGSDPFRIVIPWTNATASSGMLMVEILVSIAIVAFFRRSGVQVSFWTGIAAPVTATVLLASCLLYLFVNLPLLSGAGSAAITFVPLGLSATLIAGFAIGVWLKHFKPMKFQALQDYLQAKT